MEKTKIDWCDSTWSPVVGCRHGCEYCYAREMTRRFKLKNPEIYAIPTNGDNIYELNEPIMYRTKNGEWENAAYPYGFAPTLYRYRLNDYIGKKGRNIFVCSMADLFGSWVPDEWIQEVFAACEKAPQHNYLFLTKNHVRYREFAVPRKENMWYGVSVTKESQMDSYDVYFSTIHTFASIEPILEDIKPHEHKGLFRSMDWIIIGAETGRRKGKVVPKRKWVADIVSACRELNIPIFMKTSLADIWGEPLIQEFPQGLKARGDNEDT